MLCMTYRRYDTVYVSILSMMPQMHAMYMSCIDQYSRLFHATN